ncbi:MAG: sugar isomerase [Phycisphaerales bacterium]
MATGDRKNEDRRMQCGCGESPRKGPALSRRSLLGGLGAVAAVGGLNAVASSQGRSAENGKSVKGQPLPQGRALRVQPALMYSLEQRQEKTSWRSYGGLCTEADVAAEIGRIGGELRQLGEKAEFPMTVLPLMKVQDEGAARQVAAADADVIVLYAASGWTNLVNLVASSKTPMVMFIRHKSGPFYLWYEIAHWRFLRQNGDTFAVANADTQDIVVDDYGEMLWRLRALYGLANAKGTKMLAIGGLVAYSEPAQQNGPTHAKEVWGYGFETITEEQFAEHLAKARSDPKRVKDAERRAEELLSTPNVTLATERKFVVNSCLAWAVCEQLMTQTGASNLGFGRCMGRPVIEMLDTPPCLVLSLANDAGYTAYCHTDLSHTLPGVLMRWIAGRPTFVCNSHFPHDGLFTVAHCAAPRKMNGVDYEPAAIMTHYESDYGAACRVEYAKGQKVTVVIPNLRCTKWQGFRGTIVESPAFPACRSQMEIAIDGDWRRLAAEMEGFHTQIIYGDYLREIGYALKKLGKVEWQSYSGIA